MFTYFQEKLKNFSELSTNQRKKGRDDKQKHAAALQRKPARREEKGDPQAGQRGRLFAADFAVGACFSCFARLGTALEFTVCAVAFRSVFRRELVCGGA